MKYRPVELMKYASGFYSDLRKCVEIDFTMTATGLESTTI